jgi:hypothetical protein
MQTDKKTTITTIATSPKTMASRVIIPPPANVRMPGLLRPLPVQRQQPRQHLVVGQVGGPPVGGGDGGI